MSIPTAADAIERYQSQVPLLRVDFEQHLDEIRLDLRNGIICSQRSTSKS